MTVLPSEPTRLEDGAEQRDNADVIQERSREDPVFRMEKGVAVRIPFNQLQGSK